MQVTTSANGKNIKAEISEEQAKELSLIKKHPTGYERVEKGSTYFFNDGLSDMNSTKEEKDMVDQDYYDNGNYYSDRTIAINNAKADSLLCHLRQWQAQNDKVISQKDWKDDNILKYYIYYDYFGDFSFVTYTARYRSLNNIYFTSEEKAKEAINVFKDKLKWYFTEYQQRLDEE